MILLEPGEVGADGRVELSDGRAVHLMKILNVAAGDSVRIGVVDGPEGTGLVGAIDGQRVELRCTLEATVAPRPRVDVLLALPRPKVMRRLWAQMAALGVGRIILTNAARVERNYFDAHTLEPERYRPLLLEGLQQARATRLPVVSVHRQFKILIEDALDDLVGSDFRIVADPSAARSIGDTIRENGSGRVLLAIGPEGGWNAFEVGLLMDHAFHPAGMGPRTLRTDTACIALLALALDASAAV